MGILLSQAAQLKVLSFGSISERVYYVRLAGPVYNLFVVTTYLPHRGKVTPSQDDTIQDLHESLQLTHFKDCIVVLGDLNEQLGWIKHKKPNWEMVRWWQRDSTPSSRKI